VTVAQAIIAAIPDSRGTATVPLRLPQRATLSLEAARVALAASEAEAIRNGWRVVIAVVDDGGHALVLARLDGAQWSSIDTAVNKARAAVAWKRPSRMLEESVNQGRTAFLSITQGMAALQGGVPIEIEGVIVGAVGVSGVKASDDEVIALAGVNALKGALS
jgi:glc operon protein GlcG